MFSNATFRKTKHPVLNLPFISREFHVDQWDLNHEFIVLYYTFFHQTHQTLRTKDLTLIVTDIFSASSFSSFRLFSSTNIQSLQPYTWTITSLLQKIMYWYMTGKKMIFPRRYIGNLKRKLIYYIPFCGYLLKKKNLLVYSFCMSKNT